MTIGINVCIIMIENKSGVGNTNVERRLRMHIRNHLPVYTPVLQEDYEEGLPYDVSYSLESGAIPKILHLALKKHLDLIDRGIKKDSPSSHTISILLSEANPAITVENPNRTIWPHEGASTHPRLVMESQPRILQKRRPGPFYEALRISTDIAHISDKQEQETEMENRIADIAERFGSVFAIMASSLLGNSKDLTYRSIDNENLDDLLDLEGDISIFKIIGIIKKILHHHVTNPDNYDQAISFFKKSGLLIDDQIYFSVSHYAQASEMVWSRAEFISVPEVLSSSRELQNIASSPEFRIACESYKDMYTTKFYAYDRIRVLSL